MMLMMMGKRVKKRRWYGIDSIHDGDNSLLSALMTCLKTYCLLGLQLSYVPSFLLNTLHTPIRRGWWDKYSTRSKHVSEMHCSLEDITYSEKCEEALITSNWKDSSTQQHPPLAGWFKSLTISLLHRSQRLLAIGYGKMSWLDAVGNEYVVESFKIWFKSYKYTTIPT